jgi:ribonuclease HI
MLIAYTDGGARGNPGPAGYGVVITRDDDEVVAEFSGALGQTTNNVAEYQAVLAALRFAVEGGHKRLLVRSDSQLLVRQVTGEYRVKHPGLQPLHREALRLASLLDSVRFEYIPRALNGKADRLANQAMDEAERL